MAENLKEDVDLIEKLVRQLEALGVVNLNASKKMGIFEKQQMKIKTAIKSSPIAGMIKSMSQWGKAITNVTKATGLATTMSKEGKEEHKKKMSVFQKLTANMIKFGVAQKISNKLVGDGTSKFRRLAASMFSLLSIFLVVGFALAALSIAFEGANSPVLKMTEDMGPLHDAMQGLVLVITGEGDEGGLNSSLDVLAAALLAAGVASLVLGGNIGILVGAGVLAVGAYRILSAEFENTRLALVGAIGVFMTTIGIVMILKKVIIALMTGTKIAVAGTVGGIIAGVGLIIGGIAGMVAYMMGAGDGIKGILIGVLSAFALFIGAILLGVAAVPAAIAAAIIFTIATVIRYWDEIVSFLGSAWDTLVGFGAMVYYGALAGLNLLVGGLLGIITGSIGILLGVVGGVFNALFQIGLSFGKNVIQGGASLIDWFISIPGTIKDGFINGFKSLFNAVTDIYNNFAKNVSFKIPNWVPVVGGKNFKLPQIPRLAEGGIVTGPTLAMIGDNPSGKEAVVPLEKAGEMGFGGGGNTTININVGGVTDRTDKRALAKEIGDLIRDEMTRSGRSHGNRRSAV